MSGKALAAGNSKAPAANALLLVKSTGRRRDRLLSCHRLSAINKTKIPKSPHEEHLMSDFLEVEDAEVERYELREPSGYRFAANRREFTQTLGAGLLIAVGTSNARAQRRGRTPRRDELLSERFHLGVDGIVTVLTSKVEVGQGSRTQISQAVAEELRLPVDQIRLIMADTAQCPDDGGTAGSRTTPSTVPRVRAAAAMLRELLVQRSAERLGVAMTAINQSGGVFDAGDHGRVTIAELAADDQLSLSVASSGEDASIVPVERWNVLGTSVAKVGGRKVVTGAATYVSDIRLPGMLYGKILRPVSYGATLKSVDLSAAEAIDGVVIVRDGEFIGCAAETTWQAAKALDAIARTCQWDRPPHPSSDELFDHLIRTSDPTPNQRDRRQWGDHDSRQSDSKSEHAIDSRYRIAYVQHAPMEPRAAVAQWDDAKLTVWTATQQPARVHSELCQVFRLPSDSVRVIVPDSGGGFGGKHTGEAAVEAARLAKSAQRPVSLRWTREEEFTWAYFRPAGVIDVKADLDTKGNLTSWDFTNYNSGGSAIETPYRVPHGQTRFVACDAPLRQGSYRALASTANTFARESAMDELSLLASADPLEFRLRHMDAGRLKDVLRAAAERFQWSKRRAQLPKNHGVGLACGTEKGSYVAACVEVEVVDGTTRIIEICQGFECGAIQNPANLRSQHAGCLIMGLGGAAYEVVTFAEGRITNAGFSSYRVPRMHDVPKLDLFELDRRDLPSVGAGETPIIAVAPAIANAICHATDRRQRSMPLSLA